MKKTVSLDDLIGPFVLTGVDYESTSDDPGNVVRFVLNGQIYVARENEHDGYRSSMRGIILVDGPPVINTFAGVAVIGVRSTRDDDDAVVFVLEVGDEDYILKVGTENSSDYYPNFVGYFNPRLLPVNRG
jgi:hypothetical protein